MISARVTVVGGGRLAPEEEGARVDAEVLLLFEPQPEIDRVQDVQHLALVFVDTLDLHVENGLGVQPFAGQLEGELGQAPLVAALDLAPFAAEVGILGEGFDLAQFMEVLHPVAADAPADQVGQPRVGGKQPAAG
ncbi:MAG: hypothetical protein H6R38_382, partial [Deltaproteobacteria bacterium]|nr:hypothetical protein [Deltaproteobacteria bacterium]